MYVYVCIHTYGKSFSRSLRRSSGGLDHVAKSLRPPTIGLPFAKARMTRCMRSLASCSFSPFRGWKLLKALDRRGPDVHGLPSSSPSTFSSARALSRSRSMAPRLESLSQPPYTRVQQYLSGAYPPPVLAVVLLVHPSLWRSAPSAPPGSLFDCSANSSPERRDVHVPLPLCGGTLVHVPRSSFCGRSLSVQCGGHPPSIPRCVHAFLTVHQAQLRDLPQRPRPRRRRCRRRRGAPQTPGSGTWIV